MRATAPCGHEWVHEIKHDGYRLIVRRDGKRVRVFTRRGFDWTGRFPCIEDALKSLRVQSTTIDGEAVWCREDGLSVFDKLHSGACDHHVFFGAHQQPRARTVPLAARVTVTWNAWSLGVVGGPKQAPRSRIFPHAQTALGLIGLGLICVAVLSAAARSP